VLVKVLPGKWFWHADKSPQDATDDPTQPSTTHFIATDGSIETNQSAFLFSQA